MRCGAPMIDGVTVRTDLCVVCGSQPAAFKNPQQLPSFYSQKKIVKMHCKTKSGWIVQNKTKLS